MKQKIMIGLLLLGALLPGQAAIYYQGTPVTGGIQAGTLSQTTIQDGNPAYVIVNPMDLSSAGLGAAISSLTVTLNVSGGMNNGLYAYLVGPNDTTVTLLNQPGVTPVTPFGNTGSGLNITLQDGAAGIAASSDLSSGTYAAAGSLAGLNGSNPNGTWTLYFSDTIAGGGNATLNGWSLDITAVPEPVSLALVAFAGLFAAIQTARMVLKKGA